MSDLPLPEPVPGVREVRLQRVLRAPPEVVYRAFTDAAAMAKWLPPRGFVCEVQAMDVRVGGRFRMSFRHLASGAAHGFGGEYLLLEPGRALRYTDVFDDPGLPGVLTVDVRLREVDGLCELQAVQAGIPDAIPLAMCHLGWQDSLDQLAALVEAPAAG